jgi:hypothetical protein
MRNRTILCWDEGDNSLYTEDGRAVSLMSASGPVSPIVALRPQGQVSAGDVVTFRDGSLWAGDRMLGIAAPGAERAFTEARVVAADATGVV